MFVSACLATFRDTAGLPPKVTIVDRSSLVLTNSASSPSGTTPAAVTTGKSRMTAGSGLVPCKRTIQVPSGVSRSPGVVSRK